MTWSPLPPSLVSVHSHGAGGGSGHLVLVPVVSKGLGVLPVQGAGSGKHDGGVEVGNDARDGAGSSDAGLGATVSSLQGC